MHRYILFALAVVLTFLGGCDKSNKAKITTTPYEKINIINNAKDVITFTVSYDGDLFILEPEGLLARYTHDGTLIRDYADTHDFTALCYGDDVLYAYDAVKCQIVCLSIENGKIHEVSDKLEVDEVLKLVEIGDYLYVLAVPDAHGNYEPGLNGYIDYGERLYKINLKTGKIKDTEEDKIIAIYGATDGTLYYYAYREDTYSLYSFNQKNGKSKKLYDMKGTGYISSFVYEKDNFICSALENSVIKCIRPSDGMEKEIDDNVFILSGNDMVFLNGNVIYFGLRSGNETNSISSVYLEDINFDAGVDNTDSNADSTKQNKDTISISTPMRAYINPTVVKDISGIKTNIIDQSSYEEALLTEIMSGNPEVDIYITFVGDYVASGVLDKNIYVPLNDSKAINSYMEKCFDYVADVMQSPSGDIWMLPLTLDSDAIWYVPENTEKFEVDLDEFRYLDSFLKLSERMPKTGSYAAYVDYPGNLGCFCHEQYDITYNDYNNNRIDFETPLYKDIFDKMWTGWVNYSQTPRHPKFRNSKDDYHNELISESAPFDKSKLIYKISGIGNQLNMPDVSLEGWRALPIPHISSDVKGNIVTMICAFINPYSKNKELALEYLEAITKSPIDYNSSSIGTMLFKDKTMYEGHYDTTQPAFEDVFNIIQDGVIRKASYNLNGNIIDDYQNGRFSLDEAVGAIQREAEMWLNE
jgi:ABC-type glycerol-3-phosphate transport system substrate-binding protein